MRMTLLAILAVFVFTGCISINLPGMSSDVRMVTYEKGARFEKSKIAIVDVSGVLTASGSGGFMSRDSSVVDLAKKLKMAESSDVKAVILRVDSPGGGVTASDIMHRQIAQFKEETGTPVYVAMQSLAASGGYYISMAADEVYISPTGITGSIGVITAFPNVSGIMDRWGIQMHAITSGEMKDAGAFYKPMSPADRRLYQEMVDDMYKTFVDVIEPNRTELSRNDITRLADGRIYTAQQAYEAGLVDGVMYLDQVIDLARERVGGKPEIVIITRTAASEADTAYLVAEAPFEVNLLKLEGAPLHAQTGEAFNYLWLP